MNRDQIFEVVKGVVLRVLPDLNPDEIVPERSLVDLGANSVDRVEVSMYSMEALNLKIPRIELHGVRNLAGLVDLFHARLQTK